MIIIIISSEATCMILAVMDAIALSYTGNDFITHIMRILFHKAHLYKSIRFIFTCGKGLYGQSEWRAAISHVEV